MYMPPDLRAKFVVQHYLDSINSPHKVELTKFIKIELKDIDNSDIIKKIKSAPDSEKQHYQKMLDTINNTDYPNGFGCNYRVNGVGHEAVIRLDSTFLKVICFTEIHY